MKMNVKDFTKVIGGQLILGDPKAMVTGACIDSRNVEPGCAFFALKGQNLDGHDFARMAARQGATMLIVSQMDWLKTDDSPACAVVRVNNPQEALQAMGRYLRMQFKGPVVGITGSNGKTTTKQMIASVLKTGGNGLSTPGNYNSQLGLPLALSKISPEHKWIVLEMGASAPGHIAMLSEIAHPTVGILTSIGPAHVETFGSLERIAESKWELMDSLPNDGCAVVPWAHPNLEKFIRTYKKKILFFGDSPSCPVRCTAIEVGEKTKFNLHIASQNAPVTLPIPGRHNVLNALAAAAAGWFLGRPIEEIVRGLETFEPPAMRMQILPHPSGAVLINDAYNANPSSMAVSLQSLVETYPERKKVVVLGSMLELGSESETYHFHMGVELAHLPIEYIFLIGPETKAVMEGAISAGASAKKISYFETVDMAGDKIKQEISKGTAILFKGSRGVHLERLFDTVLR